MLEKKFVAIPALPSASPSHSCVCPICDKPLNKERIHGILEHNDDSLVEGVGEAAPQLILQIFTILSDAERKLTPLHLLCLASSFIMVSKCSTELFLCESLSMQTVSLEGMFKHERSNKDSMLKGRSVLQKLWLIAQISPAFLTTSAFYTCSIALFIAFFTYKTYSLTGIAFFCVTIPIAFFFLPYNDRRDRLYNVLIYGSIPFILMKSPYASRKECFPKMMTMAITRLILHTLLLVVLMIWFLVLDPTTHLTHWSEHRFFFRGRQTLFLAATSATLLLGPISLLFIWRLKHQVKTLAKREGKLDTYWGTDKQPVMRNISSIQQPLS